MKIEKLVVGEINFDQDLYLEVTVGKVDMESRLGTCKVEVYSGEGQTPHFHITCKEKKWECCIEIYRPLYFNHGSKQGKLNNRQCKILDDWMKEKTSRLPVSNWSLIDQLWYNGNNPMTNVPPSPKKPDYTQLNK